MQIRAFHLRSFLQRSPHFWHGWLVVLCAFFCGMALSATVSWADLTLTLTQFHELWAIPHNRATIMLILLKVLCAGIIAALLATAGVLVVFLIRSSNEDEPSEHRDQTAEETSKTNVPVASPSVTQLSTSTVSNTVDQAIYLTLTLLHTITVTLHIPGTNITSPVILDGLTGKALQLIAYVAWHQGEKVPFGDMRDQIFGSDEKETSQVQEAFNTAKREIRRRLAAALTQARTDLGDDAVPHDLDLFEVKTRRYCLPSYCKVTDLALICAQHSIIERAENSHQLIDGVPESVYKACRTLIEAYKGDFIEQLLESDPTSFDQPSQSWAREPFTLLRDHYLQALFYAGEYERTMADTATTEDEQRSHFAEAARLFSIGAMAACESRVFGGLFDMKISLNQKSSGPHVLLSEQFIRRAVTLYGKLGQTVLAKQKYATYEQQMRYVSSKRWSPDPETLRDLEAAVQQTGAYRFGSITTVSDNTVNA